LRSIASEQGFTIKASGFGKMKMVTQVAAVTLLILGSSYPALNAVGGISLYFVVLFAIWSAVDYFKTFWTQIDSRFKERERRRLILLKKRQRAQVPRGHVPTQ
jgi:CDP-diacylglycerol--glycerol-3-phosphate 3-phosphatidyltransferase